MSRLILMVLLLVMAGNVRAQDFTPGEQAKGYLEGKNVTVDHATGILHYKIPLYTLRSGEFELPVSLDYTAKGVKEGDHPGFVGYNWILNTGGIVTRTIRGGVADESNYGGYVWMEREVAGSVPLQEDVERVNQRGRDGESDIFTAVFNGQSVSFIIGLDASENICAFPLERTNVRVQCELAGKTEINGWIVTDENGNRYIYRQKEYTLNINTEGAISFNCIYNQSYISSWYLSRIEPLNGEPIVFHYLKDVTVDGPRDSVAVTEYLFPYTTTYQYGRSLSEHPFDFSKYTRNFSSNIKMAIDYLGDFVREQQLKNELYTFERKCGWVRNPFFEERISRINMNIRIMGQLADFNCITNASNSLIQTLDYLVRYYGPQQSFNAQRAASCFRAARSNVIQCLTEVNNDIRKRETSGYTYYTIHSPVLSGISSVDQSLKFDYVLSVGWARLTSIKLKDMMKRVISEVSLKLSDMLDGISFLDKNRTETGNLKFDYYDCPAGQKLDFNKWGYRSYLGEMCSSVFSLKTITTVNGGRISVDYESNVVATRSSTDYDDVRCSEYYGGIRIKSLILDDSAGGVKDTVTYSYPVPGMIVYDDIYDWENVNYRDFKDDIFYDRVHFRGTAFLNTGNNGVYYRCVRESVKGKGTHAYLFHVPTRYPRANAGAVPYAFWLNGLLLGTAVYDENGNLKRMVKNRYYTDPDFITSIGANSNYFENSDNIVRYSRRIPQVKAYEYYMDRERLNQYYQNQKNTLLYNSDVGSRYFNPYEEVYLKNIEPRTHVVLPEQRYSIYSGGKTLLKEQVEYRFENFVTGSSGYDDFFSTLSEAPFQRIEYFYDNLHHSVLPTRITRTDSRGDTYTTVQRRVTEMDDSVDPVIGRMKQANLLAPVVRELQLKNNVVLGETVSVFNAKDIKSTCYLGLFERYIYFPGETVVYQPVARDTSWFTREKSAYLLDCTYEYKQKQNSYMLSGVKSKSESSAICFDFLGNQTVLKVKNALPGFVAVSDMQKYGEASDVLNQIQSNRRSYNSLNRFCDGWRDIPKECQTPEYVNYLRSIGFGMMLRLINGLAGRNPFLTYDEILVLLDSVRANGGYHTREFGTRFEEVLKNDPSFVMITSYVVWDIQILIMNPSIITRDFLECRELVNVYNIPSYKDPLRVTAFQESRHLKIFALTNGGSPGINYTVTHSGGTTSLSLHPVSLAGYQVQVFDIDLSSYTGVTSVLVEPVGIPYVALVPDGTVFEAVSYNLDGTVFCKFDQTGQLELNEYDPAGRLVRVKNQNGDVLKECLYNIVKKGL